MGGTVTEDDARAAHQAEVDLGEAAQQALQNQAVMAYFERAEQKAIDALLSVDLAGDPTTWLRLTTVAQTMRKLKEFLVGARDAGAFVSEILKASASDQKAASHVRSKHDLVL
jgi:hypothetical protein